jgi:cell division protein FtsI/penicillin-binding protein 2
VAAKTGTPEVGGGQADHSWLAGYLPRRAPRLAFAVLMEHTGEHGADACVPVFNALLEQPETEQFLLREVAP